MAVPLRTSGLSIVRISQTAVWFLVRRIVIYLSLIFQVKKKKEANYPCSNPRNPLMKFYVERVETFNQGWISGRTRATPEELAKAGFFCLGEGDRTKCYYCNGELQNWKQSDDPWIEHAKWFPNCQYLLRIKGPHFVRRHFVPNLHLSHSTIERQVGQPTPANGGRTPSPTQDMTCSEEGRRRLSKAVEFVSFLGYPMEIIRRAIEERVRIVGEKYVQDVLGERVFAGECTNGYNIYNGTTDLLEDVVKTEQEEMERKKQEIERKKQDQRLDRPVCYGVTRDICADPPIEQTRHIPPGDHRKESYRLSTFKQFPSTCPVQKQRLVKAGFYFTGFKDRVKCFACGKTVEQWVEGDDPLDGKWHRSDCPMAGGQECGNVPLHSPETPIPNAHFPPIRKVHGTETNSIPAVEHPESEGETQMNFLCRPAPENGERASPHAVYVIVPKEARKRLKQAVQYISLLGFTTGEIKRALEENLKEVAEKLAQPELDEKRAFAEEACCILFNGVTDLEESVRKKKEKERRRKKQVESGASQRLYVHDQDDVWYVVDTGADMSAFPVTREQETNSSQREASLLACNKTEVYTYGKQKKKLRLSNGRDYEFEFIIAKVAEPMLGADFITYFGLTVELDECRLEDKEDGSYIYGTHKGSRNDPGSLGGCCVELQQALEELEEVRKCMKCSSKHADMCIPVWNELCKI